MIEKTIVVFKPECKAEKIQMAKEAFKRAGFKTIRGRYVMLTPDVIQKVFTRHRGLLLEAVLTHLQGQSVLVVELEGENVIQKARNIIGISGVPEYCDSKSLRYRFASEDRFPRPADIGDGRTYSRNYIFRSHDTAEAACHAEALFDDSLLWMRQ